VVVSICVRNYATAKSNSNSSLSLLPILLFFSKVTKITLQQFPISPPHLCQVRKNSLPTRINARSALTPHRGNSRAADPSPARAQASPLAPFVFPRVFFFPRRPDLDLIHEGERRPSPRRQGRWRPPRPAAARIPSCICSIFARFRPDLADVRIG
jgi:hypothetical protein